MEIDRVEVVTVDGTPPCGARIGELMDLRQLAAQFFGDLFDVVVLIGEDDRMDRQARACRSW